ncbi:Asp23/Gls24 family envelope stress response protein [Microbacterium oleivorans]|uniref:Asp23/Gls24 family envelope stress response protein n=1 Tax=Microbacterium oleivorans TaxID=273677 RepID=UPI0010A45441|nr:Asp23/Gls24 family envelope stress response protein [Microbacterium oleivorans]THE07636.1 Asp23/Gls24 family envelope stress response protein [Microbacterium oleivorans]
MAENKTTTPAIATRVDRSASTRSSDDQKVAGRITITDGVVAKVAGIAAREVTGVYALGGGGARALGAIRDAVNATDLTQGVKVEVGETQAAADLKVVVEYPAPIGQVADQVRASVAGAIERLTGLDVVEVNVEIHDVHIADDDEDHAEPRVA